MPRWAAPLNNAQIQALPSLTRNVPDLLVPSARRALSRQDQQSQDRRRGDSRQGAVNGGRSDQGNVTLDGVDDNDQVNGFAFTGVLRQTQDSIEEFRVTTGAPTPTPVALRAPRSAWSPSPAPTTSMAPLYWYHRPTFTVANDWFNKQAAGQRGSPNVPGKLCVNIFGGGSAAPS